MILQDKFVEYDFHESLVVKGVYDLLKARFSLNESFSSRFDDHVRFLSNPLELCVQLFPGYLVMRQIACNFGLQFDWLIARHLSLAFPIPNEVTESPTLHSDIFNNSVNIEEITTVLNRTGYYSFPSLVELSRLRELQSIFSELRPIADCGRVDADISVTSTHPILMNFALHPTFLSIASNYLGVTPVLDSISLGLSKNSSSLSMNELNQNAMVWHFDKDRTTFIKFFVYLNDVDASNGPHQYVENSRSVLHSLKKEDTRFDSQIVYDHFEFADIKTIAGKAGSVFVGDTHTIHRGLPVLERERCLLQFQYSSSLFGDPFKHFDHDSIRSAGLLSLAELFPRVFQRYRL